MTKRLRDEITRLFTSFAGPQGALIIQRPYIDFCEGDHLAALMLSQIIYWSDRTDDPDGWFSKSYDDWKKELCMTEYQVKRAIKGDKRGKGGGFKGLQSVGIETKLKSSKYYKGAATIHYRINYERLSEAILNFVQGCDHDNVQNGVLDNVQNATPNNVQNVYTETITETTKETKERDSTAPKIDAVAPATPQPNQQPETPIIPEKKIEDLQSKVIGTIGAGDTKSEKNKKPPTPRMAARPPSPNAAMHDALLTAFGLKPEQMTKSADRVYWAAAAELAKVADFSVDRVIDLYWYVKRKSQVEQWRSFTVMALAKYAPNFLRDNPPKIISMPKEEPEALPMAAGGEDMITPEQKEQARRLFEETVRKLSGGDKKR